MMKDHEKGWTKLFYDLILIYFIFNDVFSEDVFCLSNY
jgi:hypothetical protein